MISVSDLLLFPCCLLISAVYLSALLLNSPRLEAARGLVRVLSLLVDAVVLLRHLLEVVAARNDLLKEQSLWCWRVRVMVFRGSPLSC
jgi:hypothetical protein